MSSDWPFEDLESGYEGVGPFYDLFADNSDLPFFLEYARKMGSPILDLAAGTCRVTLSLALEGFEIVAMEKSESMLAAARKKLEDVPNEVASRIELIRGTMREFFLNQKFPLIIVPNSFGHLLTNEDQLSMLSCVHKHLTDDGLFILDLYPGEHQYEQAEFVDAPSQLPDGRTVTRYGKITSDFERKLMRVDLRYVVEDSNGTIIQETNVVSGAALIFKHDIDNLILKSGFKIVDEFGDFEMHPYTMDSGRRIFILKK
ncbi:MAG: class I SAM-dependent DNA methyltransferase [Candidatus Thorarchaeota archaeon]